MEFIKRQSVTLKLVFWWIYFWISFYYHTIDSQKFGYVDGTTYEYDYTTDIDTSMQGASEDKSGILMTAKVYIDVVSKCEMSLRVRITKFSQTNWTFFIWASEDCCLAPTQQFCHLYHGESKLIFNEIIMRSAL